VCTETYIMLMIRYVA